MATNSNTQSTGCGSTSEPTVVSIVATKRNRDLFQHYDLCKLSDGTTKARCKKCAKLLCKDANTTLRNHVNKWCPVLKTVSEEGQSSMGVDGNTFAYSVERTRESLAKFVIQETLPFNHFDNQRLTKVIQENFNPRYRQVSRTTLKSDCMKMWKIAKRQLIDSFEALNTNINLTTDVWSAPHGLPGSYLCVTAHWVDPTSWQMIKRTIAFENFEYPHTGQNLFYMLRDVMRTFKIENKVFSIAFDNASNNTNAVQKLILKYKPDCEGIFYHGRCVAHILNLVVQSGLSEEDVEGVKSDFKKMLQEVFCGGKARYKSYMRLCHDTDSVFLSPTWDTPTRWNSTLKMFESALRQQETLKIFHDTLVDTGRVLSRFHCWETIQKMSDLLQVFKTSTTLLSGVYYPTSHLVLNEIWLIVAKLSAFEGQDDLFDVMIKPMKAKIVKYFKEMPPIFTVAAALNPTLNVSGVDVLLEKIVNELALWETDMGVTMRMKNTFSRQFHSLYMVYYAKYGATPSSSSSSFFPTSNHVEDPRIDLFNAVQEENSKRARGDGSNLSNSEYGRYTSTNFVVNMRYEEFTNFNILEWWKAREPQFPVMAAMARDVLSAQASTVASESAFSTSGRVLSIRRTKLTPASLEMCICLKDHLDAAERVQNSSRLEDALEFEADIHMEEVVEGNAMSLSDEEIQLDEAMRANSEED